MRSGLAATRRGRRVPRIEVRITPEPSDEERALIVAAVARAADGAGEELTRSVWLRTALGEASESEPGYESEPGS